MTRAGNHPDLSVGQREDHGSLRRTLARSPSGHQNFLIIDPRFMLEDGQAAKDGKIRYHTAVPFNLFLNLGKGERAWRDSNSRPAA
jgi:hypothetical protein